MKTPTYMASFRYSPVDVSTLIKPRSQQKTFLAKVQSGLLKAIKKLAVDLNFSVNDLLEEVVKYLLKKYKKEAQKITPNCEVMEGKRKPHFSQNRWGFALFW